jgi:dTDP-4-amino-4,6-dideoxygalactose transaminase
MLALLGGAPAFSEPLHVGRPNRGSWEQFEARLRGAWERNWFTNDGPLVREFEAAISQTLQVPHCLAVCNATVGLELAVRALGLSGEVIVPAFTFVATAHCLRWQGIRPIFCDVDPLTHQISVASAQRCLTPRTTGIIGVHLWGHAAPVDELQDFARQHRLKLLFDAAHSFGSTWQGRPLGSCGDAEVFSFHATKYVNSFEGGAITTTDPELAERMRLMRNFGFAGYDRVIHVGTNGKMSEACAAMGLTSLEAASCFTDRNRENLEQYRRELAALPGLSMLPTPPDEHSNLQYVVLEIDAAEFGLTRNELLQVLQAENILARRYFYPGCHRMEPYLSEPESAPIPLPVTEGLVERVLQLPTGTAITPADIRKISTVFQQAIEQAPRIRQHLGRAERI